VAFLAPLRAFAPDQIDVSKYELSQEQAQARKDRELFSPQSPPMSSTNRQAQ
jgi:hypothetical protein